MKILLIRHPQIFQSLNSSSGPRIGLPLGILYIASYIRKVFPEINIKVLDALVEFPHDAKNPGFKENGFIHFGMTYEEIAEVVDSFQPDIVGISNQYSDFLDQAIRTARVIKKKYPQVPIVMGGNPSSSTPEKILNNPAVDIVVMGEGEFTMVELIKWKGNLKELSEVSGIAYRSSNGSVVINNMTIIDDIDVLPLPAYDLVDMERYFQMEKMGFTSRYKFEYPGSERAVSIITSRGCPFQCCFCSIKLHMGKKYRVHSAEYVIKHIDYLITTYNVKYIHYEDDNLTLNKARFDKILDGLKNYSSSLTWDTPNGIRIDTLDRDLIKKMVKTGCVYVIVGIESGSQEVQDKIVKKRLNLKVAEENIKIAHEEGLDVHAFYIIGFPGETGKQIKETINHGLKMKRYYNVVPHLGIANPIEGTEMYEKAKNAGWIVGSSNDGIRFQTGVERRFKRKTIRTPEFDIQYLNNEMTYFAKKIILMSVRQAIVLCIINPKIIKHLCKYYLESIFIHKMAFSDRVKQLFLRKLFYPCFFVRVITNKKV